jgi:hypothetical protein
MTEEAIMAKMTDEEAEALDQYYTEHTIMPVRESESLNLILFPHTAIQHSEHQCAPLEVSSNKAELPQCR